MEAGLLRTSRPPPHEQRRRRPRRQQQPRSHRNRRPQPRRQQQPRSHRNRRPQPRRHRRKWCLLRPPDGKHGPDRRMERPARAAFFPTATVSALAKAIRSDADWGHSGITALSSPDAIGSFADPDGPGWNPAFNPLRFHAWAGDTMDSPDIHNDIEYRGDNGLYLIAVHRYLFHRRKWCLSRCRRPLLRPPDHVSTGPTGGWRGIGKGGIFSVWDVANPRGVRGPDGAWIERGDYEGSLEPG